MPAAAAQDTQQALVLPAPPHTKIEMTSLSPPPPAPATALSQAEEGSSATATATADEGAEEQHRNAEVEEDSPATATATADEGAGEQHRNAEVEEDSPATATATTDEGEENRRKAEAWHCIELGTAAFLLGILTLCGCFSYFNDADHENIVLLINTCFLLAFGNMVSGGGLVQLGVNMLGRLRADGQQYVAAKWLAVSCIVLPVLTLFSFVALLWSRQYQYIGLAVVTAVLLLAAGMYWWYWYLQRRTGGSDEARNEERQATSNTITSSITYAAFAGLLPLLFNAPEFFGADEADAVSSAPYVAIFFMLATGLLGLFVMKVRFHSRLIIARRVANALLLCSLACAALAAGFVVLRYRVVAAFTPLVVTGIICFLLGHCATGGGANDQRVNQEQLKAIKELASKVTFGGFGLIVSLLGATIGAKDSSQLAVVGREMSMVVLTSGFVSGLGIMLLAAAPGSVRALMAPAAKVLIWSSVALFAATAAVYGAEVRAIK